MCLHLFLYHFWFHSFKTTAGIFALLFITSVFFFFIIIIIMAVAGVNYSPICLFCVNFFVVFRVHVYHVSCFIFKLQSGLVD